MLLHLCYYNLNAQQKLGARLTALGMNNAAINDEWNLMGNPAGITSILSPTIAIDYLKYLYDSDLSRQALLLVSPMEKGVLGFCVFRYGISAYNEITIGSALAKKFGKQLSVGLKINFHQIKISGYGTTSGYSIDVGTFYALNDQLALGFYLKNPTIQKYSNKTIKSTIPSSLHFGVAYKASNKVLIATSIGKQTNYPIDIGLGVEYSIVKGFDLRTGLTFKPFTKYAGVGIAYKKISISITVESNPSIDYKPQLGISYAF